MEKKQDYIDGLLLAGEARFDKAADAFNAGFTSKAGKKKANDFAGRAFEFADRAIGQIIIDKKSQVSEGSEEFDRLHGLYWSIPSAHHWKPEKHAAMFEEFDGLAVDLMNRVAGLRAAIKAAPISPPQPKEGKERTERVERSVREEIERRKGQFCKALDVANLFKGLPVSVNPHFVTNAHGTTFIRCFYYLAGELTPLNVIIAAAEAKERGLTSEDFKTKGMDK